MLKVIVIGSPGTGKSTFARKMRDMTGIPLYYLDMLWHKKDQTNSSRAEFDKKIQEIFKRDKWIIRLMFVLRVRNPVLKKREDLPWIELEFDKEFKKWIIDYSKDQLPQIYEMLRQHQKNKK